MISVYHTPVLMDIAISYLINPLIKEEIIVDGTLGGGSYTESILKKISDKGKLISIDKDLNALEHSRERFKNYKKNLYILNGNFANIRNIAAELNINSITGLVLDLGLSSYQLNSEDGFSFLKDTPLDMRADKDSEKTASDIVNEYSEKELTDIFETYGEIKNAKRLSKAIMESRRKNKITTTSDFVRIVQREYDMKKNIPSKFFSKIFQALRIEVNNELSDLEKVLEDAFDIMQNGGRIVVISYHSLEDRIVKEFFRNKKSDRREIRILTKKVVKPDYKEVKNNNRARSAKLRAAEVILI
ncbi:MAG: 16S rRNA (cytosine(1402)-N(4))-methyltransferase RsmH [Candidatus Kapaibacterium sp.]